MGLKFLELYLIIGVVIATVDALYILNRKRKGKLPEAFKYFEETFFNIKYLLPILFIFNVFLYPIGILLELHKMREDKVK